MIVQLFTDGLNIIAHPIFISVAFALVLSQFIKALYLYLKKEKIGRKILWQNGAMPSSHTACMTALAVSTYFNQGVTALTIVCVVLTVLVARDALGVRFQSGLHARAINTLYKKDKKFIILDEKVGHTFSEVIAGAAVGTFAAVLFVIITSGASCGL